MKAFVAASVVLLALSLTSGCQHRADEADVTVELTDEPSPPTVGKARLTLDVRDAAGKPVEGATLKLEGNMSHAGMRPVFADAREVKPGRYEADLSWTMAGDWFVLVSGKLADGRTVSKKIDVKGVKAD